MNDFDKINRSLPMSCESVLNYGRALCLFISQKTDRKPVVLVGRDARLSSEVLESAFVAGVTCAGGDCIRLGIVPAPAVSYLVPAHTADASVMLCTSPEDRQHSGIRLFSSSGFYLSDEETEKIEQLTADAADAVKNISCSQMGRQIVDTKAQWDYNRRVISQINTHLHGVKVALDCANGACSYTAKNVFEGVGASCDIINAEPDGTNTNPMWGHGNTLAFKNYVADNHYAAGFVFDGEGDKLSVIDETGAVVDNDRLLSIFAAFYKSQSVLKENMVVTSTATNLGVANLCESIGCNVICAKNGKRYIAEKMLKSKYSLGGDTNGHIFFEADIPVSDAQLTALRLIEVMVRSGKKLSELAAVMERCPQVLLNIKINPKCKEIWKNDKKLSDYIEKCTNELGKGNRVIVREHGSDDEPAISVLVEGRNFDEINKYAMMIADKIKERVKPPKKSQNKS